MAFYGWPVSQCQFPSTRLATQLQSGVRVIDIRLTAVNGRLTCYHGIYPQRSYFSDILATLHAFLSEPPASSETVVMSIKQEDPASPEDFSKLVHEELCAGPGGREMWFLENRIPLLGEVRGKVVMFCRFGSNSVWNGGLGIHPTTWPDSEKLGFEWECNNTVVKVHDW
jgi:1-phosphatidylinositol phosphodiesterase